MLCPICKVDLLITDRSGIEIDYCPKCRGVWLDRGELDKLIERALEQQGPSLRGKDYYEEERRENYRRDDYKYKDHYEKDEYYYKKKKKGFLGEIFDFD